MKSEFQTAKLMYNLFKQGSL